MDLSLIALPITFCVLYSMYRKNGAKESLQLFCILQSLGNLHKANCFLMMPIFKKLMLWKLFYGSFFPAGFVITCCSAAIIYNSGLSTFVFIFWFKIITTAIFMYAVRETKSKEFYYYRNLGLSTTFLFLTSGIVEFLTFVLFLVIATSVR